jgi:ribosome-binding factor A
MTARYRFIIEGRYVIKGRIDVSGRYRKERYGDMLQKILAAQLAQMRDPRLQLVTITEVRVTGDLKNAKVYWTVPTLTVPALIGPTIAKMANSAVDDAPVSRELFPVGQQVESVMRALRSARGLLRRAIGEQMACRVVPELFFEQDVSAEYGSRIDSILQTFNL